MKIYLFFEGSELKVKDKMLFHNEQTAYPDPLYNGDEDIVCLHSTEEVNRDETPLDFEIAELEKKLTVHIAQSEDEAYALYQDYANLVGFSVRKGKQYYINGTKVIRSKTYLCSKEGVQDERSRSKGTRTQHNSRTQCKAMITFDVDKDGL
ncbi:hypothetical protein BUALT_Bualt17G0045100 [Buddleja alternifolia]|uniref:FAR1 domain-containing protein n=1 Tax=Buddleja alternifolia TaxID=168488 RepID=A0AAV6W6R4_9LAMI|nr:hypothetical protein BUALT_Bualt17G0045100 [Buddleja alternifolia]